HRAVSAASLGLSAHVALRTRAIDDAIAAGLARGARQLVLLGAGLDSRAERMPALAGLDVFEVDHPATHRFKLERLAARTRPGAGARVVRVPIDFEKDRLSDALDAAGFDRTTPAFFVWEGVTVYLGVAAIAETIGAVAALAAPTSRLAVTYSTPEEHARPRWLLPVVRGLATAVGEPARGFVSREVMHTLLERAGFTVVSDEGDATWSARYWPGEPPPRAWERLAVAERR
ncbi:MAG TPA: class I SAM-dependent methyltransferase, partial [Minicystis sp.]|nr:class I SAM-dependent methyltransferase [Minicystis sp.]